MTVELTRAAKPFVSCLPQEISTVEFITEARLSLLLCIAALIRSHGVSGFSVKDQKRETHGQSSTAWTFCLWWTRYKSYESWFHVFIVVISTTLDSTLSCHGAAAINLKFSNGKTNSFVVNRAAWKQRAILEQSLGNLSSSYEAAWYTCTESGKKVHMGEEVQVGELKNTQYDNFISKNGSLMLCCSGLCGDNIMRNVNHGSLMVRVYVAFGIFLSQSLNKVVKFSRFN